jgi:MFS family permease
VVVLRRSWTRREVLRDGRFFLALPAVLAPGFIMTGLFIHQGHLVTEKGWSMTWYASCFVGFAAAQLPASLLAGPLVDRVGARRLVPFMLLPLGLALLVLAMTRHPAGALAYLVLAGLTSGVAGPTVGALWAELYGVAHLGAIRALVTSLGVFATAVSPVLMGLLIDAEATMETIALLCLAYAGVGSGLLAVAVARNPSREVRAGR